MGRPVRIEIGLVSHDSLQLGSAGREDVCDSEFTGMEDEVFVQRIQEKIEKLTEGRIDLQIDHEDGSQLRVEFEREVPLVVLGANIFKFSGFARMCVEYSVESIRKQRPIEMLEFHLLLARN